MPLKAKRKTEKSGHEIELQVTKIGDVTSVRFQYNFGSVSSNHVFQFKGNEALVPRLRRAVKDIAEIMGAF